MRGTMRFTRILSVYADSVEELAETVRRKGASVVPKGSSGGEEPLMKTA